jgi:N-acetylglucosamine kinase-like BadF-type ATPase
MSVVVGIDGGATKTACVVLPPGSVTGEAAGQGLASSSNKNSVGKDKAEAAVAEAVDQALSQAGKARSDVSCIVIGMSGCDTAEDVSDAHLTLSIAVIITGNS